MTAGILIRDKYGQDIFGTNTFHHEIDLSLQRSRITVCSFRFPMDIGPGKYTITAALHSKDTHLDDCFHWADSATIFEVSGNYGHPYVGVCKLHPEISVLTR
jgi:lipopolysaccharide transport system ATP-binding protein